MSKPGNLYLIPVPISEENALQGMPAYNINRVKNLNVFIAEDARNARRFLKQCGYENIQQAEILELNEHTKNNDLSALLKPLLNGQDVGLVSDAGCPGIADPGAEIAALAHQKGINIIPLVGPSAIVLSIMASGFNGQNFAFVGYLPVDRMQRAKRIKELEQVAHKQKQAQFFIETPYRNDQMMESLLTSLAPTTRLFVGINIGSDKQSLQTKDIATWKKAGTLNMHKVPVVFGIY